MSPTPAEAPHCTVHVTTADDWQRIKALRLDALAADPDAFGSTLAREADQPESFWRDRHGTATATLIAVLDGADVGITVVASSWDDPRAGAIFGVWVRPSARGHGAGDALMAQAIESARAAGFERVVLEVGDHNAPAIALYARMGFEPTGRVSTLPPPRTHITEHERAIVL
ncbi:MAG: GNAT family N-acetyltransferase [Bradymonadia bacterium]